MAKIATYGLPEESTTLLESIVAMAKGMDENQQAQFIEAGRAILLVGDLRDMADNKPA